MHASHLGSLMPVAVVIHLCHSSLHTSVDSSSTMERWDRKVLPDLAAVIMSHRKSIVIILVYIAGRFGYGVEFRPFGSFLMSSVLALPQGGEGSQSAATSRVPSINGAASRSSSTVIGENDRQPNEHAREDLNEEYHREAYGPDPGEKGWDQYEVRFAPNDPEDPQNWSRAQRWFLTILSGLLVLNAYVRNSTFTRCRNVTFL